MVEIERVLLHRLAQIMGHDSLDTTLVYARGMGEELQRVIEGVTVGPRGVQR